MNVFLESHTGTTRFAFESAPRNAPSILFPSWKNKTARAKEAQAAIHSKMRYSKRCGYRYSRNASKRYSAAASGLGVLYTRAAYS